VLVTVENGRAISIRGDREHPLSKGYSCIKGLQGAYALNAPDRITRPLKRMPNGALIEIGLDQALDEIAASMKRIIAEDSPRSIAVFKGTQANMHAPLVEMIKRWTEAIGSPSLFSTVTIDQSAKFVAIERLGLWLADRHHFLDSEVVMIVGGNPLVSISVLGITPCNMTKQFKAAKARGMKLIVVDPRRTETAAAADIHLQLRPGEDVVLFAGLLREILAQGWEDADFCRDYVADVKALREAVAPFTLDVVAERAGVPAAQIHAAAKMFAHDCRRGFTSTGTGPNMGPRSNLAEHLIQCMNVVCGRFNRAGDQVRGAGLIRPRPMIAQVMPPRRGWESGVRSRVRQVGTLAGEMMSGTLPEEILTPGEGRIRALVVTGGNPAMGMPDQAKTVDALKALEMLVVVEPFLTATAKLAHYVLPPTLQYEREDFLFGQDYEFFNPESFQQYLTPVVPHPEESELIEDWRVFWELAARLGKEMRFFSEPLDMRRRPTTEDLMRRVVAGGPISIDEMKKHPQGMFVDVPPSVVLEGRIDPELTFRVAPHDVVAELVEVSAEGMAPRHEGFHFRLISRRMREVMNTLGMNFPNSRERVHYNPAFMHPDDLVEIGVAAGDRVTIESDHGAIEGIVAADPSLRPGCVSMTHCWGGLPEEKLGYDEAGSCTSLLVSVDQDCEKINAMPRMTAIPVRIIPRPTIPTSESASSSMRAMSI
jgi:anaerobic selenocysteine-containing dehydrogenase